MRVKRYHAGNDVFLLADREYLYGNKVRAIGGDEDRVYWLWDG
jgi:hypothetical protein